MDSFHAEVSQLVDASQMRLDSGKDDDELTVCTYAFRSDCSTQIATLLASLRTSP